jgi:hypothetical protein
MKASNVSSTGYLLRDKDNKLTIDEIVKWAKDNYKRFPAEIHSIILHCKDPSWKGERATYMTVDNRTLDSVKPLNSSLDKTLRKYLGTVLNKAPDDETVSISSSEPESGRAKRGMAAKAALTHSSEAEGGEAQENNGNVDAMDQAGAPAPDVAGEGLVAEPADEASPALGASEVEGGEAQENNGNVDARMDEGGAPDPDEALSQVPVGDTGEAAEAPVERTDKDQSSSRRCRCFRWCGQAANVGEEEESTSAITDNQSKNASSESNENKSADQIKLGTSADDQAGEVQEDVGEEDASTSATHENEDAERIELGSSADDPVDKVQGDVGKEEKPTGATVDKQRRSVFSRWCCGSADSASESDESAFETSGASIDKAQKDEEVDKEDLSNSAAEASAEMEEGPQVKFTESHETTADGKQVRFACLEASFEEDMRVETTSRKKRGKSRAGIDDILRDPWIFRDQQVAAVKSKLEKAVTQAVNRKPPEGSPLLSGLFPRRRSSRLTGRTSESD